MPLNLELKARISSRSDAEERARRCGAEDGGVLIQTDTYFRVPAGRLKLREEQSRPAELIYYQRGDASEERLSEYLTTPVNDPAGLKESLSRAIGVRAIVRKVRHLFLLRGARIHIDEVDNLGNYLEFEIPVETTGGGTELMKDFRAIFEPREGSIEKRSYVDLLEVPGEGAKES